MPIAPALPELVAALAAAGRAVLRAPPGAGKTTAVPLALLGSGIVAGRILMLEPRRVAARAAAERLAESLGERPGLRVGYRMRGESVKGAAIEVVTEGILTRMIQSDPELHGIGLVIFDEFHERALATDLGLALALEIRGALRPDLKLLIMSATLDIAAVSALLGDAPIVTAEGRAFPVETRWLDRPAAPGARLEAEVAELTLSALRETEGGVLVFLPGQAEIARTAARLAPALPADVSPRPLHGGLSLAEQRAALAPLAGGRKLVLATAIAETSLTIPDIRVVIDAGRARRARFDPGSGMSRLVTERVTRAEAEQRRGRAGRVAPGWCYRLWTRGEEGALGLAPPPEILAADLTGLALEIALWGGTAETMPFPTPPPAPALAEARALLTALGALDPRGAITPHGRALAGLPTHPRLGHMLRIAAEQGAGPLAADLAALAGARDPVRGAGGPARADLAIRLQALRDPGVAEREHPVSVDRGAIAAIRAEAKRLRGGLPAARAEAELSAGAILSLAYPDRIGKRRAGEAPRYLLSGGKGAVVAPDDPLGRAPFLVIADLDGDPREAKVRTALPVTEAEIRALHAAALRAETVCEWSRRDRAVLARRRLMLGAVALEDRPWTEAPPDRVAAALAGGVRDLGLQALPWTPAARRFAARAEWLRGRGAELPDFSEAGLLATLEDWLAPALPGRTRAEDLARVDLLAALEARLDWEARRRMDALAPVAFTAPTGTRVPIDYDGAAPSIAVRVQELFGLTRHPVIGPDQAPLVVELLSPAGRPVQTTADLPGFWASSYADVRRDLRGRYPRHPWPEDPAAAEPTRRAKPRG
ncbi:MAG: ATP-dependent helicase HrpB [Rhodovulum sulfidophilum]|uniref:ATP-dependent helicase HrpB n=1 Tax=Rhodovulum sulfidophilum TaxID=35806 RepID=A0A2W5N1B8_RHOSU|nr:MAG: ATP-dependent helicase HrpB [Rhodovulum sulfidophilum]